MELFITFLISFAATWFVSKIEFSSTNSICPYKEAVVQIAQTHKDNKKIAKEVREYSLIQIQNGYFEYEDVLNKLSKKES